MKRIIFALCLALLGTGVSWAKKAVVWDTPAIGYGTNNGDGFFNLSLDVTRVELRDDETVLSMTLRIRPDRKHDYLFAPDTRLRAGGKDYALVSVEGLEPGKPFQTDSEAELQAVFHFRPVPRDVRSIDLIEGDGKGIRIEGIRPPQECWDSLVPSYWRNEATGAWEIAFMDSCAIYGCRFWQYERRDIDPKTGRAEMTLRCGDEELRVFVGENRKGRREMRIGQERLVCSMLTGRYLPDYPVADTRPGFADNGYSRDTVTVTGWLKDMPERFRKEKTFSLGYSDILSGEYVETFADLDDRGRFTVRIPVTGCTEFSCDCGHCFVRTMLEPGRTYFMLYDFKEGRRYFMGDDVRLQNELFRFPMDWNCLRMEDGDDFDRFFASVDSLLRARSAYIDSFCAAHPSLSARFRAYREGNTLWQQAREFGQARFRRKEHCLPDSALRYARVNFWDKLPTQLTMYRDISQFLTDFIAEFFRSEPLVVYNKYLHGQLDKIASNDEELAVLTRWEALTREVQARVDAAPTMEEKVRIWSNSLDKDGVVLANKRQEIMKGERVSNIVTTLETAGQMREYVHILDSLRANTAVRNI